MSESFGSDDLPRGGWGARTSIERVTEAASQMGLKVENSFGGVMVQCPLHTDRTPSMHVSWQDRMGGGLTMLYCHSCQAPQGEIVAAMGLQMCDLFDEPPPPRDTWKASSKTVARRKAGQRRGKLGALPRIIDPVEDAAAPEHVWEVTDRYRYLDAEGLAVEEVVRSQCTACEQPHKKFVQRYRSGSSWRSSKPAGFVPVLYRLPEVLQAVRDGVVIYAVEGEKDVHSAERVGLVSTTAPQGAQTSWHEEQIDALAGARVVVVLDRDGAGYRRGVELHRRLSDAGSQVDLVVPAVEQRKADLTDHLEAGFGVDDLVAMSVEEAQLRADAEGVEHLAERVVQASEQTRLRWDLAEAGQDTDTNRRYATRWATESQIRYEALQQSYNKLSLDTMGEQCRVQAAPIIEPLHDLVRHAQQEARLSHTLVGIPVPASLLARTASPVTGPDTSVQPGTVPAALTGEVLDPESRVATDAETGADLGLHQDRRPFRIIGGKIMQWDPHPAGKRADWIDDETGEGALKPLLSTVVLVSAREFSETVGETEEEHTQLMGRSTPARRVLTPRRLAAVRLRYPDPVTGEWLELRVGADEWHDHSWLEALPGPIDYDHKRAGLDQLQRAILAVSADAREEVLYRATGWRSLPEGGHGYVHRRGMITATGHRDAEVALSGPIQRFDLPDPVQDATQLRTAWWDASATLLDRVPERVAAPLLGHVFRAALTHNPWVCVLVGSPGSYKTSLAAKVMHHFGELWDHSAPATSMSGNGDTLNALRIKLYNAKDAPFWADDFAPTAGWAAAQKLLEESARLIHNQEAKSRSTRDGGAVVDGGGPRGSGLFTSEVMPRPGSGAERMIVVPLAKEDIRPALLFPLNERESRHQRALLMSSFISWLAQDLPGHREQMTTVAEQYEQKLMAAGETVRAAQGLSHTWAGWVLMTQHLQERGAITQEERRQVLARVNTGLVSAAKAATNPDLPRSTSARVRELLGYALRQGLAYVDDVRTGECPPWPLAGRLGWRRTILDAMPDGSSAKYRYDRCGMRLGYVLHDPDLRERGRIIMCDSAALEAVLKAASATQTEKLEIDRTTALRALFEDGSLLADTSEGRTRHTIKCRLYAEDRTARMVALHLDLILGEEPDEPTDDTPGPAPLPPAPTHPAPGSDLVDPQEQQPTDPQSDAESGDELEMQPADLFDIDDTRLTLPPAHHSPDPTQQTAAGTPQTVDAATVSDHDDKVTHTTPAVSSTPVQEDPVSSLPRQTRPTNATQAAQMARAGTGVASDYRAAAAVVDIHQTYLSNGESVPTPHINHLGDLAGFAQQLQLGTQTTKYLAQSGQVWLTDQMAHHLGIDVDTIIAQRHDSSALSALLPQITAQLPCVTDAIQAGWSVGSSASAPGMTRWTRIARPGQRGYTWVVITAALNPDELSTPLLTGDPEPFLLAWRLGQLSDALGMPYHVSPSTTGLDLMMALRWKDKDRLFQVHEPVPPAETNVEVETTWTRKPTEEEAQHEWVHAYDRSGSYLAGVSGLNLPIGTPTHHPEGTAFSKTPGYWRIEVPESGDWRIPNPLDPTGKHWGRQRWLTTPGLEFAIERGYEPQIVEAWTWAEHSRVLDPWYEQVRDARARLDRDDEDAQIARDQLKLIYASTIGMLGSSTFAKGTPKYQPEWRHHIVAKARTNVLRRIQRIGDTTGRWPVAVHLDTVLYTSNDPDPVSAWPGGPEWLGRELGKYKPEGSVKLADHLQYLTGEQYKGKQAITDSVEA